MVNFEQVNVNWVYFKVITQLTFPCSKSRIVTLLKGVKYVQSSTLTFQKNLCVICLIESSLKMMKNAFILS